MRVDIFVPTHSAEEQVQFYVHELQLFTVAHDYGMDSILLRHVTEPSICLQLSPRGQPYGDEPLFCLSTDDCEREYERLRGVSFTKGGLFVPAEGSPILEYPLGKTFSMTDASGNFFVVTEWHPNAA